MRRIVAIGAIWTCVWWAIVGALVAPVLPCGWATIAAIVAFEVAALLVLVQRFRGVYPSALTRLFVFRPFWYLQLGVLLMALAGAAAFVIGTPFGYGVTVGRAVVLIVATAFTAAALVGYLGSRQLRTRHLIATLPQLPRGLDGLRIVQVSDLHVGPHTSRRFLRRVAVAIEAAQPDLIAVTGDQVDDYPGDVAHFTAAFGHLKARHGVFAIAGNHDVYAGWADVRNGLTAMGVTVLVNDSVAIVHGGDRFWLAGTGDPAGSGGPIGRDVSVAPDIERTLVKIPAGAFTIALAHNPALWPALAERGVSLTLSGHTHHGQLSIPHIDWSLASLFLEHAMGWHVRGSSLLYINPGTNYWGLPLRIGASPEVSVLVLRRDEGSQASIAEMPQPI